ncbi:complement factor H-like [Pseudoliparis swirei]|uniref:complement factor H-like n=1 Tax=Pseudoliparis swirei TaxID=2059687 RepID=UPI0024BD84D1|nr:complement factor H-like [Pseudoliparis swirei]
MPSEGTLEDDGRVALQHQRPKAAALCVTSALGLNEHSASLDLSVVMETPLHLGSSVYKVQGYEDKMRLITQSWVLFLWMYHLALVKSQVCRREQFLSSEWFDSNFDITGLQTTDPNKKHVRVACKVGYSGFFKLICEQGQWDTRGKRCEHTTCEVSMMQPNLSVTGLPPGHKLQFHCDDGFTIDGSTEIECLHTGEWNAAFPTCAGKCEVADVANSVYLDKYVRGDQLNKGQRLSFNCRHNGDTLQGKAVVECSAGGQWSDPFPTCGSPAGCGRPPQVANGDITQSVKFNYRHGDWVEYGCQNYYVMNGSQYKTCLNGEWNQPTMRCLNPCTVDRRAMRSHNIHFRYNYEDKIYSSHDDHITFVCDSGKISDGTFAMRQM